MPGEKLLKKNIKIAHLYFTNITLNSLLGQKNFCDGYKSADISAKLFNAKLFDIIFIEIQTLNKQNFSILTDIVSINKSKEIYIFAADYKNTVLLKFTNHYALDSVMPLKDDAQKINNLIEKSIKKINLQKETHYTQLLNSSIAFLIYKEQKLTFANKLAFELLGENELFELENTIKTEQNMSDFIADTAQTSTQLSLSKSAGAVYWLFKHQKDQELLIIILPQPRSPLEKSKTIDRFTFIESLKDTLAQDFIEQKERVLLCINLENYDKLIKTLGSLAIYDFVKTFIQRLYDLKKPGQQIVQWSPSFFVILEENESFASNKLYLDTLHQKLIYSDGDQKVSPIIVSSALSIKGLNLGDVLAKIELIERYSLKIEDGDESYFELHHLDSYLDPSEQIRHYLKSCLNNKTPIKLLNIYKGLCINTQSFILKITDDSYFVHCESLQGYSMQFENKTVLQAPDLPKDIQADISYINIEKSYAILDNLSFLNFSANNRAHTRVQPNVRLPIAIKHERDTFSGIILDISIQAIAIKLNAFFNPDFLNHKIELRFKLPDASAEDGYVSMLISGSIINIMTVEETRSKIVVHLELTKPFDSYLLRYMYNRQKELIVELKRASR